MTLVDTPPVRTSAPLGRVVLAELRWVLRRPRNLLALLMLAALPVLLGTAITLAGGPSRGGPSVLTAVAGNGLVLPVAALVLAQSLLLPLVVAMVAADALAGESAHGTLRGLLLAPVSRVRLVGVKAVGVLVMAVLSVTVVAVSGVVTGLVIVGGDGLVTLSGTTLPMGSALGRVALAVGWSSVQMAAVGAVALAISAFTDHPLVVMAATMGGLITFGVLGTIPALDWLHPLLLTTDWSAVVDVLRDPLSGDTLATGLFRAGCYLLVGMSVAVGRIATKDV
ncbi:membrane protein [Saccharopolyspora subtropica]|uniref:Membrane protein n=1 Tax=Saccharopolyspora thermophila TaxID=89367 RepID=A0A917NGT0_9PSEU|nr:ABC transporter permease [Saccharopolyspora subtropica]GGI99542.1 membrane protein [Saccharopolyspora subtropica]